MRLRIFSFLLFGSYFFSFAQDSIPTLSTITLTAHGSAQPVSRTGRSIWIIPGSLLRQLPVYSVDDLLRFIPGVEVQQRGPQGVQGDILIRGGTFQQVLVLIDGVRYNDPLTGHFNAYMPIDPLEIDRIEILKGPASAVWGSEAVGGVIQIFTKTFSLSHKAPSSKRVSSFQTGAATGSYSFFQAQVRGFIEKNNTRFSISGNTRNSEGAPQRGTNGFFNLHSLQTAVQHTLKRNWIFRFRTALDWRDFSAQNFYTTFLSDTAKEQVNTWWNHAQLIKQTKNGFWQTDVSYKYTSDRYRFRPAALPNLNKMGLSQLQLKYQSTRQSSFEYQTGFQLIQRQIKSNDRGNHAIEQWAFFGTGQFQFGESFFANGGMRFIYDELYGFVIIPQLSASYVRNSHQWRIVAGRSFRDADFTERYNNYNKNLVTSGRIGNPGLSPEDAWQFELGYDFSVYQKLNWHNSLFYRNHRGLIDWVQTPYLEMPRVVNLAPTGTYALAKNIEAVNSIGWETDLQFRDSIGKARILTQLGLLWLSNNVQSTQAGFYLNSHARFLINGLVDFSIRRLGFSTGFVYKKRNQQTANALNATLSADYFLLNTRMQFSFGKKRHALYLQADNLLNRKYSDLLGAPMPGRWLSIGARFGQ